MEEIDKEIINVRAKVILDRLRRTLETQAVIFYGITLDNVKEHGTPNFDGSCDAGYALTAQCSIDMTKGVTKQHLEGLKEIISESQRTFALEVNIDYNQDSFKDTLLDRGLLDDYLDWAEEITDASVLSSRILFYDKGNIHSPKPEIPLVHIDLSLSWDNIYDTTKEIVDQVIFRQSYTLKEFFELDIDVFLCDMFKDTSLVHPPKKVA